MVYSAQTAFSKSTTAVIGLLIVLSIASVQNVAAQDAVPVDSSQIEILEGTGTDALRRSKRDGIATMAIYAGTDRTHSPQRIATVLAERLQELGISENDLAAYITNRAGKNTAIEFFVAGGEAIYATVIRNGEPVRTSVFLPNEAYELLPLVQQSHETGIAIGRPKPYKN